MALNHGCSVWVLIAVEALSRVKSPFVVCARNLKLRVFCRVYGPVVRLVALSIWCKAVGIPMSILVYL